MREIPDKVLLAAVAAFALLSWSTPGAGQQQRAPSAVALDAEAEEEAVPRYSVELIIFEYLDDGGDTELFLPDFPETAVLDESGMPPDAAGDDGLAADPGVVVTGSGEGAAAELPSTFNVREEGADALETESLYVEPLEEIPTYESAGFEILDPEDFALDEMYDRLDQLDAYRPIMRGAWIQPALEREETLTLKLRRIGNPPLRLNGTVTLYLSRFLHLVVDVAIEEKSALRPDALQQRIPYYGDARTSAPFGIDSAFLAPPVFYRIQEDRIVRNGELRYFDHPKFGVLAKVVRIEEEADADPGE